MLVVQTKDSLHSTNAGSAAITFGTTLTAGNIILFALVYNNNGTVNPPASLTVNNTSLSAGASIRLYSRAVHQGDSSTWTFTFGTSGLGGLIGYEVSGCSMIGTLDGNAATVGTAAFPADASITTATAGNLIIAGGIAMGTTGTTTWNLGSGYSQDFLNNSALNVVGDIGESRTQGSAGAIATGLVTAGSGWSVGTGFGAQFIFGVPPSSYLGITDPDAILTRQIDTGTITSGGSGNLTGQIWPR